MNEDKMEKYEAEFNALETTYGKPCPDCGYLFRTSNSTPCGRDTAKETVRTI